MNLLRTTFLATTLIAVAACSAGGPSPLPTVLSTGTVQPSSAPTAPPPAATTQQNPASVGSITGQYEVNGRELFIDCAGSGSPTIVIEAGEAQISDEMADVRAALAKDVLVCSYDRANHGLSGSAPKPRTAEGVVSDLYGLLHTANVPGPYLIVGHSAGGMFVQLFARTHAAETAGMLIMNPVPPCDPWMAQGFLAMTESEQADERAYYAGANDEPVDYCRSSHQIDAAPAPTPLPVEVLISTIAQCASAQDTCGRTYPAYTNIMRDLAAQWPAGHFSQVESIHSIYDAHPEVVLDTIAGLRERIGAQGS